MRRDRILSWAAVLSILGASAFAVDAGIACHLAERERDGVVLRVEEAHRLLVRHPEVFGRAAGIQETLPLKGLLQEVATREGVAVGFLSETERDAGQGRRERQAAARLVGAEHGKLVRMLVDLEARGGGARVKELHLRPSKDVTAIYEEVEIVFARDYPAKLAAGGTKP